MPRTSEMQNPDVKKLWWITLFVQMTIDGQSNSVIIAGQSGIGKTQSTLEVLAENKLKEIDIVKVDSLKNDFDNIDGDIAKSAVTLQVSGVSFPISLGGDFPINFVISDSCGNITNISGKTLHVVDDIPPILNGIKL